MQRALLLFLSGLWLLSGCARSPERSYYTLRGAALQPPAASQSSIKTIALEALTVPETVDRLQFVTRAQGTTRLEISESHRWAEPLSAEIAAVLAEGLSTAFQGALVTQPGQAATLAKPDLRLRVDITQFEGSPGQSVFIEAVFSVPGSEKTPGLQGRQRVEEPVAGIDYDALTAAYRKALLKLASALAAQLH